MSTLTTWHLDGDRFAISIRDHMITVDQPVADGGQDTAPTPTELFVASLASCVGPCGLDRARNEPQHRASSHASPPRN
jgi:uncharacterized OsmC-like protein